MALSDLNIFNIIYNIPLLLFDLLLFFVFLLLARAVVIILTARGNELKFERGKRNLFAAFFWLFLLIVSAVVFSFVNNAVFGNRNLQKSGEFPILPNSSFPPGPAYVKVGRYYFAGPWKFKEYSSIKSTGFFAVMCKKDTGYDIIYTSRTDGENLLDDDQYNCWVKNCDGGADNLYVAVLYTKSENFSPEKIDQIRKDLNSQFVSRCGINSQ